MKLQTIKRAADRKSEAKRLRREGYIPAVLYAKDNGLTLAVQASEFQAFLRQVKPGHLPTTIFTLTDEDGKSRRAVVKDIQYEITTYDVTHLDFEEIIPGRHMSIKVPIECTGQVDCVGIKLGGVLRQVIRHVRVRTPRIEDLPSHIELDIRELALYQSKRVKDLQIPETVRLIANLEEVVAVIVKR